MSGAPVGLVYAAAPHPPARGNPQEREKQPTESGGQGNREKQSKPLPERHSGDLVLDQKAGKFVLDLAGFDLLVKFGHSLQSFGGNQPDLAGAGIVDANEIEIDFDIAGSYGSDLLMSERHALLGNSIRLSKGSHPADESGVHHGFQLGRDLFTFGLPVRGAHLQILRRDAVVARLRGVKESEHATGGRGAIQRIGGRGWRRRCRLSRD